jgi:HEPN domain-containing protein
LGITSPRNSRPKKPELRRGLLLCSTVRGKYIKARLVEANVYFKKVHDLSYLLGLAAEIEPLWMSYEQEFRLLTDYAVEFRYPGASADLELARIALKICQSFRKTARQSLAIYD